MENVEEGTSREWKLCSGSEWRSCRLSDLTDGSPDGH